MGMQLALHMVTIEELVPREHYLRRLEAVLDLSCTRKRPTCTAGDMAALPSTR